MTKCYLIFQISNFKLKREMQINRRICGLLNIVTISSEMVALGYTVSNGNLELLELARVSKVLKTCGRLIKISAPYMPGHF